MSSIAIERESDDRLSVKRWRFWYDDRTATLWLDSFEECERPSRRHNYVRCGHYNRLHERISTLALNDVPLPEDVAAEAIASFTAGLTVKKWSDR